MAGEGATVLTPPHTARGTLSGSSRKCPGPRGSSGPQSVGGLCELGPQKELCCQGPAAAGGKP